MPHYGEEQAGGRVASGGYLRTGYVEGNEEWGMFGRWPGGMRGRIC